MTLANIILTNTTPVITTCSETMHDCKHAQRVNNTRKNKVSSILIKGERITW